MAVVIVYDNGLVRAMQTDGKGWNQNVAYEVLDMAQLICPGQSGRLRASHRVAQNRVHGAFSTGFNISAGNGLHDARAVWVHNGTGIYGPRGTPIVPVNTPKKKYMHLPGHMGFRWKLTSRNGIPVYDPADPYGHASEVQGDPGNPWLRRAGYEVTRRHGGL